jgi:WD40 repeat protein
MTTPASRRVALGASPLGRQTRRSGVIRSGVLALLLACVAVSRAPTVAAESYDVTEVKEIQGESNNDLFGRQAAISRDGSRVAFGSLWHDGGGKTDNGRVVVYEKSGGGWSQFDEIEGDNSNDGLCQVAFSQDGTRMVVGVTGANTVRVYEESNGAYGLIASFTGDTDDRLGVKVAISDDGTIVAASSSMHNDWRGNVRVWEETSNGWTLVQKLSGDPGQTNEGFGGGLAFSSDGGRLVVGAAGNDAAGENGGAVGVYERDGVTGSYEQLGTNITTNAQESFGQSVSISADGNRIAVGAPRISGGYVRVYDLSSGDWVKVEEIRGSSLNTPKLGGSVSLSSNGTRLVASDEWNSNLRGSVYVFQEFTNGWSQIGSTLVGDVDGECFGNEVSISGDGTAIAAGGDGSQHPHRTESGLQIPGVGRVYEVTPSPCNLAPPTNGALGSGCGGSTLQSGQTCQPTCDLGYDLSGETSCFAGTLTSATCSAKACVASTDPNDDGSTGEFYCIHNGTIGGTTGSCTCTDCDAGYGGDSCQTAQDCTATTDPNDDGSTGSLYCPAGNVIGGTTGSCTCSPAPCAFPGPPTNGAAGTCVNATLASGTTCAPSCDDGFRLVGVTSCSSGTLTRATCDPIAEANATDSSLPTAPAASPPPPPDSPPRALIFDYEESGASARGTLLAVVLAILAGAIAPTP